MGSQRKLYYLFLTFLLATILFSVFAQSVGATYFFDDRVSLRWKSDPALRAFMSGNTLQDSALINVLLVFWTIPTSAELTVLSSLCIVHTFTGHVATISATANALPKLAALSFVSQIAMPKMMKPELDVSVPEILADQVWNTAKYPGVRDSTGRVVDGTGVIIGVADSGIDYLHQDFFRNGTSKVLYIWDQTLVGRAPNGYDYGNECTPTDIQTRTCSEYDDGGSSLTTGHGTAVASVAASTGQASHNYYGVAPGASIIAVKLIDGSENYVIDAMNYMIQKARALNRPLVIVHSLGDSLGSHDGTEPLELAFTDFAAQGVPIVVAAGNDRNAKLHVSGILSPGEGVNVPWSSVGYQNLIDLWYPMSSVLGLAVTTPSGQVVTGPTPDFGINTADGNVIILTDMRPTGKEWWINITTTVQPTFKNLWSFTLTSVSGPGVKWDAWTEPGQFVGSNGTMARIYSIDPSDTIDSPGTALGVITVGGYITKYSWLARCTLCIPWNQENHVQGLWSPVPGTLGGDGTTIVGNLMDGTAGASGAGPTRDGRTKPEITAPAGEIVAARASSDPQICDPYPGQCSDPDDYHTVWAGTSFAAPHVAGVIALMLQMNPHLSPNEIRAILEEDARQDNFTGPINKSTGSPLWGWGKVNALRSTLDAVKLYAVRITVASAGIPFVADVTVDGETVERLALNQTRTLTFEFTSGGNHTIELTPILNIQPGTRYVLYGTPWTFSSGGSRDYTYQEQHYFQVNSQYGSSGTGWYDENATAVASVVAPNVDGYQFQGWNGSVVSSSPTITVTMDSAKAVSAVWTKSTNVSPQTLLPATIAIVIGLVAVIVVARLRRSRGRAQDPSATSPPPLS